MGRIGWLGFVVFLVAYSWWKYTAAAPDAFSSTYAQSVLILVALTGVAPFLLTYLILRMTGMRGLKSGLFGVVLATALCVGGYALFWYMFIASSGAVPVISVALRGLGWGALQGGLASLAAGHRRA